jgi:hypothetical protein
VAQMDQRLWGCCACRRHQIDRVAVDRVGTEPSFGFCYALGELIGETASSYIYRNRAGVAFVGKSSLVHFAPCAGCVDYQERDKLA